MTPVQYRNHLLLAV
ncbi:hypothetical protein [Paenibacillus alba]